jgi:predicted ATP-binding protein involved in virulence
MYFKSIEIENTGPIDLLKLQFPMDGEKPKPLLIVGANGSGKSILLSHLVNFLIIARNEVFDDVEVEKGKVFKIRSPSYIMSGKDYSYSSIEFDSGPRIFEWQLRLRKSVFEDQLGYSSARKEWNEIPEDQASLFGTNFQNNRAHLDSFCRRQCCLYFPVNRFEDPAWLNLENMKTKANYVDLKHITGYSNRKVICTSPLRDNRNWLLDVLLDRSLYEMQFTTLPYQAVPTQQPIEVQLFAGYKGPITSVYTAVIRLLKVILRDSGNVRLGAGPRNNRQISVMKDEIPWIPNLFQLSTGEAQLLNLFASILRDFDLSDGTFNDLTDIKGIVIIDEIDAHLHAMHQKEVLPELIASFPNVQFVITTHSPLFLLGMKEKLGSDAFNIISLPDGASVVADDFTEFTIAYEMFRETERHRREIKASLEQVNKPIVFVEGEYDIRYLMRAAELLGKQELIAKVQLKDGCGFGNLDRIWRSYDNKLSEVIPGKILLIYDCDTHKANADKGFVFKRVIPSKSENPIAIGIENLFSEITIGKADNFNPNFIDIQEESKSRMRGMIELKPPSKSINKDEKGNLCEWLCSYGDEEDFRQFNSIFELIEKACF